MTDGNPEERVLLDQYGTYEKEGLLLMEDLRFSEACESFRAMLSAALGLPDRGRPSRRLVFSARALNHLADACIRMENHQDALEYLRQASAIYSEILHEPVLPSNFPDYGDSLILLGQAARQMGRPDQAAASFRKALEIFGQEQADPYRLICCRAMEGLGLIAQDRHQYLEANTWFMRSWETASRIPGGNMSWPAALSIKAGICRRLGSLAYLAEAPVRALEWLEKGCGYGKEWAGLKNTQEARAAYASLHLSAALACVRLKEFQAARDHLLDLDRMIREAGDKGDRPPLEDEDILQVYKILGDCCHLTRLPASARKWHMIFYLRCRKACHAGAGSGHSQELAAKRMAAACYRVLSDEVDLVGTWYSDKAIKLYSRFARRGDPKAEDMCLLCQELHAALLRRRETYAERLFEHYRDLSDRAETLEKEMGIRFSESCSNREKLLEDLLDYLKPLVPSDRSDQAALVLGRLLRTDPTPLAESLKDRTRAFPLVMIPDSAAALVQTDQRRRDLEKYRDGDAFAMRMILYTAGWKLIETFCEPELISLRMRNFEDRIARIDLYIEEKLQKEN